MATTLFEDISQAFRSADPEAESDALAWAANRAADLMAEANRQKLTELWKGLAAVHHEAQRADLTPELREQRGYLAAIVHLSRAVRDQCDDLLAIQGVKSHARGPAIVSLIKKEGTIRHGELAKRLGIKPPSLTQAMHALADSRTITATMHGKFKYYSLTPIGMIVAKTLDERRSLRERVTSMKAVVGALLEERPTSAKACGTRRLSTIRDYSPTCKVICVSSSRLTTYVDAEAERSAVGTRGLHHISQGVLPERAQSTHAQALLLGVLENWRQEPAEELSCAAWVEPDAPGTVAVLPPPNADLVRGLWASVASAWRESGRE